MSPLFKNTYREILRSPGRFLAILAIIVLGSGFFVGLRVSQKAMTATANTYLDKTSFYDFSAANTLGTWRPWPPVPTFWTRRGAFKRTPW